ncbi:MAG TPA: hypothetical protein VE978_04115 [Chitinophagales bacterium]|nr:hypothetical protein [Chitinophagales bacterium]
MLLRVAPDKIGTNQHDGVAFTCQVVKKKYFWVMKVYTVGDLKAHFSEVLDKVQEGEEVYVAYGKKKEIVAQLIPHKKPKKKKRKLGGLKGKVKVTFHGDWHVSDEELLNV